MHRAWINIKSAITGMNEHAVLAECERGEDTESTLRGGTQARSANGRENDYRAAIQGVKENHDRVRDLRNAAA